MSTAVESSLELVAIGCTCHESDRMLIRAYVGRQGHRLAAVGLDAVVDYGAELSPIVGRGNGSRRFGHRQDAYCTGGHGQRVGVSTAGQAAVADDVAIG